jgi:Flp pilus assembly protein TadG
MMRRLSRLALAPFQRLAGDRRGSNAAEFALTLPVFAMLIFSLFGISRVYYGRAGVLNGLGEAARVATLWPARSQSDITNAFNQRAFGLGSDAAPLSFTTGISNGQNFVDIRVSYTPTINLFLIQVTPITLTYTRRAYRPT